MPPRRAVWSPTPQPTSSTVPGAEPLAHLAVAGVVEREEGVGGGARHRTLTGERVPSGQRLGEAGRRSRSALGRSSPSASLP